MDINGGSQPIKNEDLVLVANGEVYNDLTIRKEIKKYRYKTKSDSESILAVYKEYGLDGFKKLRGMFSFAIHDEKKNINYYWTEIYLELNHFIFHYLMKELFLAQRFSQLKKLIYKN